MYFNAAEIPNFFTDEECEMIIELAQEKGLKESPLSQDTGQTIDKDSVEDLLKEWDKNNDGFVDKTEVRQIFMKYSSTLGVIRIRLETSSKYAMVETPLFQ